MYKTIGAAVMVLALATSGSVMLGGTAQASSSARGGIGTVPTAPCRYTIYIVGIPFTFACPQQ